MGPCARGHGSGVCLISLHPSSMGAVSWTPEQSKPCQDTKVTQPELTVRDGIRAKETLEMWWKSRRVFNIPI
ncbi:hypothetical protein JAAARDRAFT_399880 [Jaapia argillacea MUCL 33604]|uniref:Uncharacterized protein n=1 Tax=Jaapia argillacea MUCL 33604 TaxID=933084 RepID=A0A067PW87_9AGAM|nr:hypothetical protein JAAARDRAFT_399880 [Jaapia argillacea MUCL 33604]